MKRLAALLLAIAAVVWVRRIGGTASLGSAGTALALGFTLVGAWIAGDALRRFQLPRLTGCAPIGFCRSRESLRELPGGGFFPRWRHGPQSYPMILSVVIRGRIALRRGTASAVPNKLA